MSASRKNRLLKEVFELDKSLFHDGQKSWYSFVYNSLQKLSITESSVQTCDVSEMISSKYLSVINKELILLRHRVQDNKLNTFSKLYSQFSLQTYLSFGLSKVTTKELSKLRISAHDLLIERGRYFRPRVPREKRQNTNLLPPKPKSTFRHLKQGIQDFHRKMFWFQQTRPQKTLLLFDGYIIFTL